MPGTASGSAAPPSPPPPAASSPPADLLDSAPAKLTDLRAQQGLRPVAVEVPGSPPAAVQAFTTDPVGGGLALPDDAATVAWYASGTSPGEPEGTVVLAAHVSYQGATGPFTRLDTVPTGAPIAVRSADGSVRRYAVTDVRQAPKTALDRVSLFTLTGAPRLVLVTCGGRFDPATRSFESNLVVTALPA